MRPGLGIGMGHFALDADSAFTKEVSAHGNGPSDPVNELQQQIAALEQLRQQIDVKIQQIGALNLRIDALRLAGSE